MEAIRSVSDSIGAPLGDESLGRTRALGLDAVISMQPSELDTIGVILWDETKRPAPPPPTGSNPGLGSTVNGAPY